MSVVLLRGRPKATCGLIMPFVGWDEKVLVLHFRCNMHAFIGPSYQRWKDIKGRDRQVWKNCAQKGGLVGTKSMGQ